MQTQKKRQTLTNKDKQKQLDDDTRNYQRAKSPLTLGHYSGNNSHIISFAALMFAFSVLG